MHILALSLFKRGLILLASGLALLVVLLASIGFLFGWALSSSDDWLKSLRSDSLHVEIGGIVRTGTVLWRHLYEIERLELADPAGGWRVKVPKVQVETDPAGTVFGLRVQLRNLTVPQAIEVDIAPWKLPLGGEIPTLEEIVQAIEDLGDILGVASVSIPAIVLRVHGQDPAEAPGHYQLALSYGSDSSGATLALTGRHGNRPVLDLTGRWGQGDDWLLRLRLDRLELEPLLAAPLASMDLEVFDLNLDLSVQGDDWPVPQQLQGSVSVPDLQIGTIPWPVDLDIAELSLAIKEDMSLLLQVPRLTGHIGTEAVTIDQLRLGLYGEPAQLRLEIEQQDLGRITETLVGLVELPQALAQNIRELQLDGQLHQVAVEVPLDAPADFSLTARLVDAMTQSTSNSWPGLEGVNGQLSVTAAGGVLAIADLPMLTLDIPKYFDAMHLTEVSGTIAWKLYPGSVIIAGDDLRVSVAGGRLHGLLSIFLPVGTKQEPPRLEVALKGEDFDVRDAWLYTPKLEGLESLIEYLRDSIQGGRADVDGAVIWADLRGGGDFNLNMQVSTRDGVFEYAPDWPIIRKGVASLEILQDEVFVSADSATISGARVGPGQVHVGSTPDRPGWTRVELTGDFDAAANQGIDFLINSEGLREFMEPALEGAWGQGQVRGRINSGVILLPPEGSQDEILTDINMRAYFDNVRLSWPEWYLDIQALQGEVVLDTGENIHAQDMTARIFGHPVNIQVSGEGPLGESDSYTAFDVSGGYVSDADMFDYVGEWNRFIKGTAPYQARLDIPYGEDEISLKMHTDMVGMAIDVPDPLLKSPQEQRQMEMLMSIPSEEEAPLRMQILSEEVCADLTYGIKTNIGGDIWFNDSAACKSAWAQPRSPIPLRIQGHLSTVSVSDQVSFAERMPLDEQSEGTFGEIKVAIDQVQMAGLIFPDMQVTVVPLETAVLITGNSEQMRGQILVPDAEDEASLVDMDFLYIPETYDPAAWSEHDNPHSLGATYAHIRDLRYRNVSLGEVKFEIQPEKGGLVLSLLPVENSVISVSSNLKNIDELSTITWNFQPEESISVRGNFTIDGEKSSLLNIFPVSFLTRLGRVGLQADISWPGGVEDFSLTTMSGQAQLQILDTAIDLSSAGSLAPLLTTASILNVGSVLGSLATLQLHRISGTWFKEIWLRTRLQDSLLQVQELSAVGTSSSIYARGNVDFSGQNQLVPIFDMGVQVRLPIIKALPWYMALLGNVTGGIGLYLLNILLGNPLDRAATVNMHLTGPLSSPEITPSSDSENYRVIPVWVEDRSDVYTDSVAR